ncbi:uncharacterized protein ACR2FA_007251 [Aphomia sociella]
MAERISECLCCITVMFICIVNIEALSGKAFYCRDPDTGKLHAVNTTWPSETFCGNYTCKLRRKNMIETQYVPLFRQFRINDLAVTRPIDNKSEKDINMIQNNENEIIDTTSKSMLENIKIKPSLNIQAIENKNVTGKSADSADRLLTEKEIKTISDLLHGVKKSDLEAIVDIYNLAQDLYKEMDKITSQNIIEETANAVRQDKVNTVLKSSNIFDKHMSYWHEPMHPAINYKAQEVNDMEHQGSNVVRTVSPAKPDYSNSYFGGNLTPKDFGRLPYYYPLTSFQRQSSYIHPSYADSQYLHKPCHHPGPTTKSYPSSSQSFSGVIKKPFAVDHQKYVQPLLLPYPFSYVQHYNSNGTQQQNNLYYDGNPWTRFELFKQNHNYQPYYIAKLIKAESDEAQVADDKPKAADLIDTLLTKTKIENNNIPDWQTRPLTNNILDEIRANFEHKSKLLKPISLRKKINLERVGKVVKLDDLNRNKRSVNEEDHDIYEAYTERTTCESDIDPGFFRVGNLTEPFPACCPQRITDQ